jgi:hypothetical protein
VGRLPTRQATHESCVGSARPTETVISPELGHEQPTQGSVLPNRLSVIANLALACPN